MPRLRTGDARVSAMYDRVTAEFPFRKGRSQPGREKYKRRHSPYAKCGILTSWWDPLSKMERELRRDLMNDRYRRPRPMSYLPYSMKSVNLLVYDIINWWSPVWY